MDWVGVATLVLYVGGPVWFFIFWHWFDFWRTRRTLAYSVWVLLFVVIAVALALARDALFDRRFDPPTWLRAVGWALLLATTAFGTVADRQLGVRVRSFMPFFDGRAHIRLRTTGAYGVVRHPIYATGIWFGLGLFLTTGWWALLVGDAVFTLGALWFTRQEEERLKGLLRDPSEYDRYRDRVGALFPRLR